MLNAVMPCFDSPYGHLRAKACWVAGQYADIDFRGGSGQGQAFGSLFQKVVNAFQDPDLPVRLPRFPSLLLFIIIIVIVIAVIDVLSVTLLLLLWFVHRNHAVQLLS